MAKDENKTKKQLIAELNEMRKSAESIKLAADLPDGHILRMQEYIQLLPLISGTVNAGVVLQSSNGSILHANKIAREILGMEEDEVLGKTSHDPAWQMITEQGISVPGDEHPAMITLRTGKPTNNEVWGLYNGDESKTRWILINTEVVPDPELGSRVGVLSTFVDITRRKVAEATLRSSEEKFRSITSNSPNFIITLDLDYNITFANRSYTGKSLEEITRSNLLDYIPEESKNEIRDTLDKVKRTGEQGMYEVTSKWIDGPARTFEGRIGPIFNNGTVDALIVSIADITGRKQVEEQLRKSEENYRDLVEGTDNFLTNVDDFAKSHQRASCGAPKSMTGSVSH